MTALHVATMREDLGMVGLEVLVLLCTPNLFSRPWCLLEIWEAHRQGKPVLLVLVAPLPNQPAFDLAAAAREAGRRLAAEALSLEITNERVAILGPGTLSGVAFDGGWTLPLGEGAGGSSVEGTAQIGPDAVKAVEIVHALYASIEQGNWVFLADAPRSARLGRQ